MEERKIWVNSRDREESPLVLTGGVSYHTLESRVNFGETRKSVNRLDMTMGIKSPRRFLG